MKSSHQSDVCTRMLSVALLTIHRIANQLTCLSVDEKIKKMKPIHKGILFSHEKNEIIPFVSKLIELGVHVK